MRFSRDNGARRPPDQDATEISPAWASTLHRHLAAQQDPAQTAPVGPSPARSARSTDDFRHPTHPSALVPQGTPQNPHYPPNPTPIPNPTSHYTPTPNTQYDAPTQVFDSTDIGAQIYNHVQSQPYQSQRVLEYYGDPNIKNIRVVVGYQVHSASPRGVLITENGPVTQRTLIPWHRVHELKAAPGDPILNA